MLHRRKICLQTWLCPGLGLHNVAIPQWKAGRMWGCLLGLLDLEEPPSTKGVSLPGEVYLKGI